MIDYAPSRRWLGIGIKSGGQLGIGGYESTTAFIANLSDGNTSDFQVISSRWGLGLGGGGGAVVVLMFGVVVAEQFHRQALNDWGLNVTYTEKLISKSTLKSLEMSARFLKLYKHQSAYLAARHVKTAAKDIEFFQSIRNLTHTVFAGYESAKKSGVIVIDLPLAGGGLELSAFLTRGTMYVSNATDWGGGS
jgi:hypothetical protein